jgi:hypothetical protein
MNVAPTHSDVLERAYVVVNRLGDAPRHQHAYKKRELMFSRGAGLGCKERCRVPAKLNLASVMLSTPGI